MRVPHANMAMVSEEKITGYLLNPSHPDGAGKAQFFTRVGFNTETWQDLANALRELVERSTITQQVDSQHGTKYIVDGFINTPLRSTVAVRTIWIIDTGEEVPRFVTAYPHQEES
jgi:hypothetical protein